MRHTSGIRACLIIALSLAAMAVVSCDHKEIEGTELGTGTIDICFSWNDYPDADPEGMTVYFFPTDKFGKCWRFDLAGAEGGSVVLPYGHYSMLAFNNDQPYVRYVDNGSLETFTADIAVAGTSSQPIRPIYRSTITSLSFTADGVTYSSNGATVTDKTPSPRVVTAPQSITTQYTILVKDVDNPDIIVAAWARMTGPASDMLMESTDTYGFQTTLSQQLTKDADSMTARFNSLRCLTDKPVYLDIIVNIRGGQTYYRTYNVIDQVVNTDDPFNVIIEIDDLTVPDHRPGTDFHPDDDVGISVGIDGWTEINIDYITDVR